VRRRSVAKRYESAIAIAEKVACRAIRRTRQNPARSFGRGRSLVVIAIYRHCGSRRGKPFHRPRSPWIAGTDGIVMRNFASARFQRSIGIARTCRGAGFISASSCCGRSCDDRQADELRAEEHWSPLDAPPASSRWSAAQAKFRFRSVMSRATRRCAPSHRRERDRS